MAEHRKPHPIQALMDNPWLLLALGIVVPTLFYTVWGWLDLASAAQGVLP